MPNDISDAISKFVTETNSTPTTSGSGPSASSGQGPSASSASNAAATGQDPSTNSPQQGLVPAPAPSLTSNGISPPASSSFSFASSAGKTVLDVLLEEHAVTPEQANSVKLQAANTQRPLEEVMKSLSIVAEEKFAEAKAKLLGVPFVNLSNTAFSPKAVSFIPRSVVERANLIPFS